MVPTIAVQNEKAVLAIGASGGSRITTAVIQVILNVLQRYPGDLKMALFAPRVHHQWAPDELQIEREGFSQDVISNLERRGHKVVPPPMPALVEAVYSNVDRKLTAVFDPRDEGGATAD